MHKKKELRFKVFLKIINDIDKRMGLMIQEINILIKYNQVSKAIRRSVELEKSQERMVIVVNRFETCVLIN